MSALNVLCAQLTRDLFATAKFLFTSDNEGCICFSPARPRSFVCLCARLPRKACMDLEEMLRVDRRQDTDELINF